MNEKQRSTDPGPNFSPGSVDLGPSDPGPNFSPGSVDLGPSDPGLQSPGTYEWDCLPRAFAYATGESLDFMMYVLGTTKRVIHPQEIVELLYPKWKIVSLYNQVMTTQGIVECALGDYIVSPCVLTTYRHAYYRLGDQYFDPRDRAPCPRPLGPWQGLFLIGV